MNNAPDYKTEDFHTPEERCKLTRIDPNTVYTYAEASALVRKSTATIYNAIRHGRLRGGGGRVLGQALLDWLNQHGALTGRNKGHVTFAKKAA